MSPDGWRAFYQSDLQGVWLAWLAPLVFLAALPWLRTRAHPLDPSAAGFVRGWCVVFALETLLDPLATGPLARALGIAGTPAGTALVFVFVLLGDFRIFLLLFHLAARERVLAHSLRRAALWTLAVPLATLAIWGPVRLARELPDQAMWLCYETLFAAAFLTAFLSSALNERFGDGAHGGFSLLRKDFYHDLTQLPLAQMRCRSHEVAHELLEKLYTLFRRRQTPRRPAPVAGRSTSRP